MVDYLCNMCAFSKSIFHSCLHRILRQCGWQKNFKNFNLISCCSHELIFNVSQAVSLEVRAHWNNDVSRGVYQTFYGLSCFSPVINIARHPLWGRTQVKTIHLIRSLHGSFRVAHSLFSFSFSFSFSFLAGNFSDQLQHLSRALESVTGMTQNIIHVIHDVTSIR